MRFTQEFADYLGRQRWCNFKEEIRLNQIKKIDLEIVPFDQNRKLLTIGHTTAENGSEHYFMMPLARAAKDTPDALKIGNSYYTDALQEPDYWKKLMLMFSGNNNVIHFPNGWVLRNNITHNKEIVLNNIEEESHPLGVEQSNTTLAVGKKIAFKQERILDFSNKMNPEFTMNEKLMREDGSFMPKTYGYMILTNQKGEVASAGITQEFVENQGDFWNYAQQYLQEKLAAGYLVKRDIQPQDCPKLMYLMNVLNVRTTEMTECLSRPDKDLRFTPEPVNHNFIYIYDKQMQVLLYQTRNNIANNLDKLPEPVHTKAAELLNDWDKLTGDFISENMQKVRNNSNKSYITRVHGDFHLGQVMVTPKNDLKFIDFAGEPAAPLEVRDHKHIYVRDIAGMYRSIKGYMGAVAVEDFVKAAPDEATAVSRREYAEKAIQPVVDEATRIFLGKYSTKDPWLALEIFRKNLYEVNYEVNNRPNMAYVAINGLTDMLIKPQGNGGHTNKNENSK